MAETTYKFQPTYQVSPAKLPTFSNEQRYAQAYNVVFSSGNVSTGQAYTLPVGNMDLANFLLQSISPIQVPPRLAEDVQVFTKTVKDIISAAHDKVITAEEADAIIGYLAEQFAARRASQALARIGMPAVLT